MTGEPSYQKHVLYTSIGSMQVSRAVRSLMLIAFVLASGVLRTSQPNMSSQDWIMVLLGMAVLLNPFLANDVSQVLQGTGMGRMAEEKAILQHFGPSVELLAGIDTLCCDVTGTLSQNTLEARAPFCINCTEDELFLVASLCLPADRADLDPVDRMYLRALEDHPRAKARIKDYKLLEHTPFNQETNMVTAMVESVVTQERWKCVCGALQAVLNLCKPSQEDANALKYHTSSNSRDGFRTFAIARRRETMDSKWESWGSRRWKIHHATTRLRPCSEPDNWEST